jgi:hypothetical protein
MKNPPLPIIIFLLIFNAQIFANSAPPRIAVYVTGNVAENDKNALGTRMLSALVNSGKYTGIERSDAFLAKIDEEHVKQRSGAIDDSQISALGKQFGVSFICIADITPSLGGFQISARIINIETAEVTHIGETSSSLKSLKDLATVSDRIVRIMFDLPDPKKRMSAGAGGFFSSDFGGGIIWTDAKQQIAMPCNGGGAFLFFDAQYAEISAGFAMGGGKWESGNVTNADELPELSRISLNFGAFGKYPIDLGTISIFPLLGIDYEYAVTAKFTRQDSKELPLDGKNGRPENAGAMSALWVKIGGGVDYNFSENMYIRASVLYGIRTPNKFESDNAGRENAETKTGHGVTARVGAGVRF